MALFDLLRARRGALVLAAFAALPAVTTDLPGEALHRLRTDRSLRTFTGLYERVTQGAVDLVSAELPWRAARPSAAILDWFSWQWFGLEASLHRLALLALLVVSALGLRASSRDRDDVAPTLLGAAFVAHPVAVDVLVSLRGREVVYALAAGGVASRLLDGASPRRSVVVAALGAFAVGGAQPSLLPWFAALALTVAVDRRRALAGLAVGALAATPALLRWPGGWAASVASSMTLRALRVAVAPVGLDAWTSLGAASAALVTLAVASWCALAAYVWRRGARAEALCATLLLVGAVVELTARATATGARVDAELLAVAFAVATLANGALRERRRGAHVALAVATIVAALGAARATAWRDGAAIARAAVSANPRDGRAALSLAWENLRAGRRDVGCRAAVEDRATLAPALACVAVEAAIAGRTDAARGAVEAYRATAGAERRLSWDFGRTLSLRPAEERGRLRRELGLPTGGAQ